MSSSFPPSPSSPRTRPLRGGYVASLACAVLTIVVFGVLLALGPWVRHPSPDFIGEVGRDLQVQVDVEEEGLDVIGIYGLSFGGLCEFTTPSGALAESRRHSVTSFDYGAEQWHLVQTMEVTESGTYQIRCTNTQADFGVASTYVADTARIRQFTWAMIWVTLPTAGLAATVVLAVVTLVHDRRSRAAEAQSR